MLGFVTDNLTRSGREGKESSLSSPIANQSVLRQEIDARGWSQLDLAAKADLSVVTVNAAVNGKPISQRTKRKIADAFDLHPVSDTARRLAS